MNRHRRGGVPCEPLREPLVIEKLVPGGQGLGTLESGQKAFVWGALPGETVTNLKITKKKKSYVEGIAEEVANPSAHRIKPQDECYLSTSPWQIMDYDYELEQKQQILFEQFRQFGIKEQIKQFEEIITSKSAKTPAGESSRQASRLYYRNKMEYALYYAHEDGLIYPACRYRGTHVKFPIARSSLERPEIWAKCQEIFADLNAKGEEARKYQTLLLRCSQDGIVSGGLIENGKSHPVFKPLKDTLLGYEYSYSPNGFFQINLPVYELALKEIAKYLGDSQEVLDLYAGVGTIGLSVARERNLTLVELNDSAYKEMVENCKGTTAQPILSASEEALEYIKSNQAVIVDPPRAGLDDKLIEKLLAVRPEKIIYLSCNPATQARDAVKLLEKYQITSCTPFNFFPCTPHLENLLIFE